MLVRKSAGTCEKRRVASDEAVRGMRPSLWRNNMRSEQDIKSYLSHTYL
jgi:hypothetical protein